MHVAVLIILEAVFDQQTEEAAYTANRRSPHHFGSSL